MTLWRLLYEYDSKRDIEKGRREKGGGREREREKERGGEGEKDLIKSAFVGTDTILFFMLIT
jgi:hypothetical protein